MIEQLYHGMVTAVNIKDSSLCVLYGALLNTRLLLHACSSSRLELEPLECNLATHICNLLWRSAKTFTCSGTLSR